MAEKRADYRKNQRREKLSKLWSHHHSLKQEKDNKDDGVDVNPDFKRNRDMPDESKKDLSEVKVKRLKKKLNWAIFIVIILTALVLLALFKL